MAKWVQDLRNREMRGGALPPKRRTRSNRAYSHLANATQRAGNSSACQKWAQRYNYWLEKTWQQAPPSVTKTRHNKMKAANKKRIWHCGLTPQSDQYRPTSGKKPKARYMAWGVRRNRRTGGMMSVYKPHRFKHDNRHRWREEM